MAHSRDGRFSFLEALGIGAIFTMVTLALGLGARVIRLDLVPEVHAEAYDKAVDPLSYMSVQMGTINGLTGPHLIISGANVHVRSGGGSTTEGACWDTGCSGLGNLIIGYNEAYADYKRTGIHNLVVGTKHGFRSHGGLVAGSHNQINQPYATVAGGQLNTVS
ncbi:MAG: hypothetical protein KC466_08410, partial [Myxococcales bacterium]|nr:hypothetical protein [Myxococcales bacterium]